MADSSEISIDQEQLDGLARTVKGDLAHIALELTKQIDEGKLKSRVVGGGKKAKYAAGDLILEQANAVLGFNNWSDEVKTAKLIHLTNDSKWSCLYMVHIRVTFHHSNGRANYHEDVGFGTGNGPIVNDVMEQAYKSAFTDARKRALRLFGPALGSAINSAEVQNGMPQGNMGAGAGSSSSAGQYNNNNNRGQPQGSVQGQARPSNPPHALLGQSVGGQGQGAGQGQTAAQNMGGPTPSTHPPRPMPGSAAAGGVPTNGPPPPRVHIPGTTVYPLQPQSQANLQTGVQQVQTQAVALGQLATGVQTSSGPVQHQPPAFESAASGVRGVSEQSSVAVDMGAGTPSMEQLVHSTMQSVSAAATVPSIPGAVLSRPGHGLIGVNRQGQYGGAGGGGGITSQPWISVNGGAQGHGPDPSSSSSLAGPANLPRPQIGDKRPANDDLQGGQHALKARMDSQGQGQTGGAPLAALPHVQNVQSNVQTMHAAGQAPVANTGAQLNFAMKPPGGSASTNGIGHQIFPQIQWQQQTGARPMQHGSAHTSQGGSFPAR